MGDRWRYMLGSIGTFIAFVVFWGLVMVLGYFAFVVPEPDVCADAVGGQCIP
mgnify:FL=1